jgi:hypothetical protein
MVIVNTDNDRLIFKAEFNGVLSDFIEKYSELIPTFTSVEVYLDLMVILNGEKYNFVTVSSDNELANTFIKNGYDYPSKFTIEESLTIKLIEESTMKGILSEVWESYSLSLEEVQERVEKFNALVNLNTQKLKTYKTTASELAIKNTNIPQYQEDVIKKGLLGQILNYFYTIQVNYEELINSGVTLGLDENKKYSAVKSIVKNGSNYYNLVENREFEFNKMK